MTDDIPYHHGNLRRALIAAALATLRDKGAEAISLRALARDIGVSHAAPARHFPTRDALFAAIAEQGFRALSAAVAQARDAGGGPLVALRRMALAHLAWVRANPALYAAMRNPDVIRQADPALRAIMQGFAAQQMTAVQAARATGWRNTEPAEVTLLSIVSGLVGLGSVLTDPFLGNVLVTQTVEARIEDLVDRLLAS